MKTERSGAVPLPIRLIVQYYRCSIRERQAEIDTCLRENLANPLIAAVHLLSEEMFDVSGLPSAEKIVQEVVGERLTYERAFNYANHWPEPAIWILANADICFDDTLKYLHEADFTKTVFALTRHDVQPDGSIHLMDPAYAHGSQDAWIFRTPIDMEKILCGFRLGIAGCDHRIAYELIQAGYIVLNPSLKVIARHLDSTRGIDIHERTRRYVENWTDDGFATGKAIPPPYQYYLYPDVEVLPTIKKLYDDRMALYSERTAMAVKHQHDMAEQRNGFECLASELKWRLKEAEDRIRSMENSPSWRVTAPLRRLRGMLMSMKRAITGIRRSSL